MPEFDPHSLSEGKDKEAYLGKANMADNDYMKALL